MSDVMLTVVVLGGYFGIGALSAFAARFSFDDERAETGLLFFVVGAWPLIGVALVGYGICRCLKWAWDNVGPKLDFSASWLLKRRVHADEFGVLYRAPSPFGEMRFVRVNDSTGAYWLTVPREMRRAKEAVAWTYHMDESEFNPVRV